MTEQLSSIQRVTLATLAQTLIPEDAGGPSAAEAQLAERWIDVTLNERPDLLPGVLKELNAYDGSDPRAYLERCERERPESFAQLGYVVAASFFRSPAASKWLGYERVRDEYEGAASEPTIDTEKLLMPVRAMGPRYRPTHATRGGTR